MFPAAAFQPASFQAWRPEVLAPRAYKPSVGMGQAAPPAAAVIGAGVVVGAVSTALGGAVSYVGIRTGLKESGFLSILGWIVGVGGGLYALSSLAATVALAVVGPAVAEQVAKQTQVQTTQTSQP